MIKGTVGSFAIFVSWWAVVGGPVARDLETSGERGRRALDNSVEATILPKQGSLSLARMGSGRSQLFCPFHSAREETTHIPISRRSFI